MNRFFKAPPVLLAVIILAFSPLWTGNGFLAFFLYAPVTLLLAIVLGLWVLLAESSEGRRSALWSLAVVLLLHPVVLVADWTCPGRVESVL